MTKRLCVVALAALTLLVAAAEAGDKEDVAAAGTTWAKRFAEDNPDGISALYAKDAVLWGTLSTTRRATPAAIREYFVGAFKALPSHKVEFGNQLIRVYGTIAINTGYLTFSYTKDGQARTIPARYSFAYARRDGTWLVVDHHSSALPAPLL